MLSLPQVNIVTFEGINENRVKFARAAAINAQIKALINILKLIFRFLRSLRTINSGRHMMAIGNNGTNHGDMQSDDGDLPDLDGSIKKLIFSFVSDGVTESTSAGQLLSDPLIIKEIIIGIYVNYNTTYPGFLPEYSFEVIDFVAELLAVVSAILLLAGLVGVYLAALCRSHLNWCEFNSLAVFAAAIHMHFC